MEPEEEVKPVEVSLRSTLFISKNGNMYRLYHDTDTWQIVMPRCDEYGKTCGYKNKSLQRLIAEAWLPTPEHETASGRKPNVIVKDTTKPSLDADNLEWCIGRRCKTCLEQKKYLPPKLELLKDILEEDDFETIEDVAHSLGVSVPTSQNYMCKLLSSYPDLKLAESILKLTNQTCLEFCLNNHHSGNLNSIIDKVEESVGKDLWEDENSKFFDVRVCRMYCDILDLT